MPITRRALLLSNPGEVDEENYCRGVYVDIASYRRLLLSPEGGAWEPSEIQSLDRPTAGEVRLWVADFSRYDYALIMFTGHGWFSSIDKDRVLTLKKGEEIASNELLKGTKRRTLVLDCCQKIHAESLVEKKVRSLSASAYQFANAAQTRMPNPEKCRRLFLDTVAKAEPGFIRMCSCQPGELSRDDDASGGYYNSSLIDCADDWATEQAQNVWGGEVSFTVVGVHEPAAAKTRAKSAQAQNPTIEKARTGPYFPFAVFA